MCHLSKIWPTLNTHRNIRTRLYMRCCVEWTTCIENEHATNEKSILAGCYVFCALKCSLSWDGDLWTEHGAASKDAYTLLTFSLPHDYFRTEPDNPFDLFQKMLLLIYWSLHISAKTIFKLNQIHLRFDIMFRHSLLRIDKNDRQRQRNKRINFEFEKKPNINQFYN